MSSHSAKCNARHPDPKGYEREQFWLDHVLFQIIDHPTNGKTFALIAGEVTEEKQRRPLFTGHIKRGMGTQLRRIAHRFDELEAGLPLDDRVEDK